MRAAHSARTHLTERPVVAYALLLGAVALTLSPLLRGGKDEFPLSSYPMFSNPKDEAAVVDQAVLVFADRSERIVTPGQLGTDEVLQAEAILTRAVRGGKTTSARLCELVAARVASAPPDGPRPTTVEIRTVTYDSATYLHDPAAPPKKRVLRARCSVASP